ncbi:nuclear transport factor 2 family protein [Rhodococcus sp. D-46]|uniref:nuclear transport factor 2 family protein n=1 Tax=Rhodococcus sp. D-46 TaxID=2716265 RepID=UPI0013F6787B|nr:nuclear transport factor 2 family protein [Rhodococcus sp. D-46]
MSAELPVPVTRLIDATNIGDTDLFLDTFAPGGVVDDWGHEFTGRDEIGTWSEAEFIGKQVTLSVLGFTNAASETTLTAQVGGNGFNGPSTLTFIIEGDALSRMNIRA